MYNIIRSKYWGNYAKYPVFSKYCSHKEKRIMHNLVFKHQQGHWINSLPSAIQTYLTLSGCNL